jgi:hypothetical protein
MILLILILTITSASTLKTNHKKALTELLQATFDENNLKDSPLPIVACLDDTSASITFDFFSSSLQKGAQGSAKDIASLVDDLHVFYEKLPQLVTTCLNQRPELLNLNYKYGIGYLPLAEEIFKNYTKLNYLKLHTTFTQANQQWQSQAHYQAGYTAAQFGHGIFPISKKHIRGVWLTNVGSQVLDSRSNILQAVEQCSRAHINMIFVVVYNNARTIYPSSVMQDLIGIKQ